MSKSKQRQIKVYAHWIGLEKPTFVGLLQAAPGRGKEIFSFEYGHAWFKR